MRACGFEKVEARYEDEFRSDVVKVDDQSATEEQLTCAAEAMDLTGYIVEMSEPLRADYYRIQDALFAPHGLAMALEWLEEHELADGLPAYDPLGMEDAEDAARLVAFCGPKAKGLLGSEYGPRTTSPDWLSQADFDDGAINGRLRLSD